MITFTRWPLYPIVNGKCTCSREDCDRVGKHPFVAWGSVEPGSCTPGETGCGYGISTGRVSGIFVIDTDVKNGIDGEANLLALGDLPPTYTVLTPSGGKHRYYKWPGVKVPTNQSRLAPGVDIRGDGGYVVASGSPHANGGRYEDMVKGLPAEAPAWLLKHPAMKAPERPVTTSEIARGPEHRDWAYRLRMARQEVKTLPPSIEGQNGSGSLWMAAQVLMRRYELPADTATDIILEDFNPRCEPEWSVDEIAYKLDQAARVGSFKVGDVAPEGLLEAMNRVSAMTERYTVPEEESNRSWAWEVAKTEEGNARIFMELNKGKLMYVGTFGWFHWDGMRWCQDKEGLKAITGMRSVSKYLLDMSNGDTEDVKRSYAWALKSQSYSVIKASVALARTHYNVRTLDLDADPYVLNCTNGVVDLQTGGISPHDPERFITKVSGTAYDKGAKCPIWLRFLDRVFQGDKELVSYMKRYAGYCLTGKTSEQQLSFLYGNGSNGKSTFTLVLQRIMGDYSHTSPSSLILSTNTERIPTAIADLRGVRLAVCQETEQGRSWDESLLKQLTGGDRIAARKLHKDFFEFTPTHKICMSGNYKPTVKGIDNGIWRRICLIPFEATIGNAEKDPDLFKKLEGELPGILNWAIEGCLEWDLHGLGTSEAVTKGTEAYREEEDVVGRFLASSAHPSGEASKKDLYQAYDLWARQEREEPMTQKAFTAKMHAKGYDTKKVNGNRIWKGVTLKAVSFAGPN